jgi:F0F1-type ATP synthase membrane subunit b/b'
MIVVIALMIWKKVPALIGAALDKKIAAIRVQLDEAARLRADAEALKAEYEAKAKAAAGEAKAILAHARDEADGIVAQARTDAREPDRTPRQDGRKQDRRRRARRRRRGACEGRVGRRPPPRPS